MRSENEFDSPNLWANSVTESAQLKSVPVFQLCQKLKLVAQFRWNFIDNINVVRLPL